VRPLVEIENLVAHEGRWPGTDAERRAANHLATRLEDLDRDAVVEPTSVRPNYALTHMAHALLAVVASVVSVEAPRIGLGLALLAVVSTLGDLTGRLYLIRRLTSRRASQNVISREDGGKPGTLILVAHYDAARTGTVFNPRLLRSGAALGRRLHRSLGAFELMFWPMALVALCIGLRAAGVEAEALSIVQFVPTAALIVAVALLAELALGPIVPGASDNASGVATVLDLADEYGGTLEHFDLWVLLPGAEEGLLLGMREWMKAHRKELDPRTTIFLNVDTVGHGSVRWMRKEGFIVARRYHPTLVGFCKEIGDEDDAYGARPYVSRFASDALAARTRGFPAVTITCLDEVDYPPHYHQPTDTPDRIDAAALGSAREFCAELIETIDDRVGPEL